MALNFNVVTSFNIDTKTVTVTDNTTYSAQGVNPSVVSIKGLLIITGPSGSAFVSITNPAVPATNISTGIDVAGPYSLPILSGDILNGTYSVSYRPQYSYTQAEINTSSVGNTVTLLGVNIADLFNAGDVFFISLSALGNNGSKTVVSAINSGSNTVISISTALVTESGVASFTYNGNDQVDLDYTYAGCELPIPAVSAVYDCQSSQFGSITFEDTTDYLDFTISEHSLTAFYPSGLNPAPAVNPQTTALYILTLTELASGTWTKNVAAELTKTQADDLELAVSFNASSEFVVTCVGTLCSLVDCIQALYTKHMDALNCGSTSPYQRYVDGIALLYPLAKEAQACGNQADYESYYNQMVELLSASGTECDCNCCGNTSNPQWIDNASQTGTSAFEDLYNSYLELLAQVEAIPGIVGPQGPQGPQGVNGSIITEGTSLYSTNPATSNFDDRNGIYLGDNAGNGTDNQKNVMIGYYAGNGASGVYNANFIGVNAGENATGSNKTVFIGHRAGNSATGAEHGVFIGRYAGASAVGSYDSNFFGNNAGASAINARYCNFLGYFAGNGSTGDNVNAFGASAGQSNSLDGQTIFSNSSMPTFANHAAAELAITVLLGASANCTYLYHNQATNSIGAVRL
jgi:hypothetical protein